MLNIITPDWPAPANVRAAVTTRTGGVSRAPYDSFNLATHVDDDVAVAVFVMPSIVKELVFIFILLS